MKITIIMSYYNRKSILYNTLKSMESYMTKDVEILIVDDASYEDNDVSDFKNIFNLNIKIIKIDKNNKIWINPCIPYNIGFSNIESDVIIIQNPECIHMGNIIESVKNNIKDNTYLTYACYSIDKELTDKVDKINKDKDYIKSINSVIEPYNNLSCDNRTTGWYNHSVYRRSELHFCSAIKRKDLYDLGGFDERYANGIAFDDNEFLERIKKKGMDIQIIDNPNVIHQCHVDAYVYKQIPYELTQVNYRLYNQTKNSNIYDVKKYNIYYK